MKIGFMVPGFSKCGTSSLCALLRRHPEVYIPRKKEPGYYSHKFDRGFPSYARYFSDTGQAWMLGEGSTPYSSHEFAEISCQRIVSDFPDVRMIFIARHPLKRVESSFRELHTNGFRLGIRTEFEIGKALRNHPSLLLDTQYWKLINHYRKRVPDERILVLFLEEFQQDPDGHLRRCFEFLGVDPEVTIKGTRRRHNSASLKRYDTRLMRQLLEIRWFERRWIKLSGKTERQLGDFLRLRKPFVDAIQWDRDAIALAQESLAEDSRQFLEFYDRPSNFWDWTPAPAKPSKAQASALERN